VKLARVCGQHDQRVIHVLDHRACKERVAGGAPNCCPRA
jgi:hypothetical protein